MIAFLLTQLGKLKSLINGVSQNVEDLIIVREFAKENCTISADSAADIQVPTPIEGYTVIGISQVIAFSSNVFIYEYTINGSEGNQTVTVGMRNFNSSEVSGTFTLRCICRKNV